MLTFSKYSIVKNNNTIINPQKNVITQSQIKMLNLKKILIIIHSRLNNFTCTIQYNNGKAHIIHGQTQSKILIEIESVFQINKVKFGIIALRKINNRYTIYCYDKYSKKIQQKILNTINLLR